MTDPNLNQPPANQPPANQPPGYAPPPPAQPYGQQPGQVQGQQPGQQYAQPYAAAPATNILAIIALIGAFVIPPAGIICGHMALGQIKKSGEGGHALALWGTILGYVFTVLWLLVFAVSFIIPILLFGSMATEINSF